jgi:hypothetical protein
MAEREPISQEERRRRRLIALVVVLAVVVICFAARHYIGDWLRGKSASPIREMTVTTSDAEPDAANLGSLSHRELKKFGKAMREKVAMEIALANNVPPDTPAETNGTAASPAKTEQKPQDAAQATPQSSEPAASTLPPEKTPMQNAMDTLLKRLEVEAFSIPVSGRRLAVFRYRYPAVRVDTVSHGVVIYGYSGESLKRVACYYRYPVSLTHGACADEIEKVFHVRI